MSDWALVWNKKYDFHSEIIHLIKYKTYGSAFYCWNCFMKSVAKSNFGNTEYFKTSIYFQIFGTNWYKFNIFADIWYKLVHDQQ